MWFLVTKIPVPSTPPFGVTARRRYWDLNVLVCRRASPDSGSYTKSGKPTSLYYGFTLFCKSILPTSQNELQCFLSSNILCGVNLRPQWAQVFRLWRFSIVRVDYTVKNTKTLWRRFYAHLFRINASVNICSRRSQSSKSLRICLIFSTFTSGLVHLIMYGRYSRVNWSGCQSDTKALMKARSRRFIQQLGYCYVSNILEVFTICKSFCKENKESPQNEPGDSLRRTALVFRLDFANGNNPTKTRKRTTACA